MYICVYRSMIVQTLNIINTSGRAPPFTLHQMFVDSKPNPIILKFCGSPNATFRKLVF